MAWPSTSARSKDWGTEILTDTDLESELDLLHTYINDMMNSSTGHKHDGTTAEGPKIQIPNLQITSGAQGDIFHNGSAPTRLAAGTSGYFLKTQGAGADPIWAVVNQDQTLDGSVVQVVNTTTGATSSGTTAMPYDDTIPQNTEGDQYMSLSITPGATTNNLKIDVVCYLTHATASMLLTVALFQDTTAGALAAGSLRQTQSDQANAITFTHFMAAGTTSATTFKVRAGGTTGATTYFNGISSGRQLGGVYASSITITEIKAS